MRRTRSGGSWWAGAWLGLVAIVAAGSPTVARTFRAADNQVLEYPTVQALIHMGQLVRERSGGRHDIQVFHSRQLGEERDTLEQTRVGAIDINRINIAPLAGLVPSAGVLSLPFLFRSEDHLRHVLEGPIGDEILAGFEPKGLVGLTYYDSGTRSIYNSVRPIRVPADLTGLRIRVQPSDSMGAMIRAFGGVAVPLGYGQVLSALQTHLIDGAENNWPSYITTGHYLLARFLTETNHTMPPEVLLISAKAWGELSGEDRALFREAARDSSRFMRERWQQWVADSRAQAVSVGIDIVTDFDRAAFQAGVEAASEPYLVDPAARKLRDRIRATP